MFVVWKREKEKEREGQRKLKRKDEHLLIGIESSIFAQSIPLFFIHAICAHFSSSSSSLSLSLSLEVNLPIIIDFFWTKKFGENGRSSGYDFVSNVHWRERKEESERIFKKNYNFQ